MGSTFVLVSEYNSLDKYRQPVVMNDMLVQGVDNDVLVTPFCLKTPFFDSIAKGYYYSSLFYQSMSKPTRIETLNYLLDRLTCFKKSTKVEDRSELLKLHHGVNPLYWFCLFETPALLSKALSNCDYEQWVYEDSDTYDPFLYSLKIDNQELIDVWADYFLKEENSPRLIVNDTQYLKMLLSSKYEKLQKLGIAKFKAKSQIHGDNEPIKVCGFNRNKGYLYCFSKKGFIDVETKKKLRSKEDKTQDGIPVHHESTQIPISINLSRLYWLIKVVAVMAPQNKLELRPLILALHKRYRWYFYIYSITNVIGNILLFVTVVFQAYSPYTLVPFFLIYSLMLIFEIINLFSKGWWYFSSVYNWFDIIVYPLGMGLTSYVVRNGYDFLESERENFIVAIILYLALMRAISMLRVVNSTQRDTWC